MKLRRWFSGMLALALCATSAGAFAYGNEYEQGASDPVTLKAYINNTWFDKSTWGTDVVSSTLIEKTGVNLEFDIAVSDDNQKLNLLIASGDLPDLVFTNRKSAPGIALIENERVYSLDELAEQYAPSFLEDPFITGNRKYLANAQDGSIYTIPAEFTDRNKINDGVFLAPGPGYYIRNDVYNAIGAPALTTLDELEAALRLAVEHDPSLTHPLFMWSPLGVDSEVSSINVLYYSMGGKGKYYEANGKLECKVRDPLYLETLLRVNRLYNEGLINVSDFTDASAQQEVVNASGSYFAAVGQYWRAIVPHDQLPKELPGAEIAVIAPLMQPGVEEYIAPVTGLNGNDGFFVSKTTQYPEYAMWFLQYLLSDEGQTLVTAGIENEHWEWGGPDKNWIVPIGAAKEAMNSSWNDWVGALGTYKYVWGARNYYDSAFCWGLAIDDAFKGEVYRIENCGTDYTAYEDIDPLAGSDEHVIMTKFIELWKNYVSKIVMAYTEDEARGIYAEFIANADQAGLPQLEDVWTANFNARNPQ